MKYWYHVRSTDLVNWEQVGIGIRPGDPFDSHGLTRGVPLSRMTSFICFTQATPGMKHGSDIRINAWRSWMKAVQL